MDEQSRSPDSPGCTGRSPDVYPGIPELKVFKEDIRPGCRDDNGTHDLQCHCKGGGGDTAAYPL